METLASISVRTNPSAARRKPRGSPEPLGCNKCKTLGEGIPAISNRNDFPYGTWCNIVGGQKRGIRCSSIAAATSGARRQIQPKAFQHDLQVQETRTPSACRDRFYTEGLHERSSSFAPKICDHSRATDSIR